MTGNATCPSHPTRVAVEICSRCGRFVCAECLELVGNGVLCTECHGRGGFTGKASGRATAALVLGLVGLNCGFLPGIIGLVLANQELAAIERGESPAAGRNLAKGGRILGYINVAVLALAVVVGAIALAVA